ncbi:hypothetical protein KPZU09_30430 [Klebsiella pneumoniae]|uniref:Molybdopterin oxidoreductase domain-containing protein n=1 Tax=Klebsiella pneumoniae TaxID=573 RepID=A0A919LZA5_KLEPN|nr:hypothetical protein KPZU09_30430 [Klebsiella pneumoniae]
MALTALLGQLGTPAAASGLATPAPTAGAVRKRFPARAYPPENAVDSVIPVARLSDMLLHPGETYEFDGQQRRYPDIRLVYWAGGNAFHHHQDLNRLCEAWRRPETVVVHEQYWTAQAKFSDIVLPATTSLEREDIGSGGHDGFMIAMSAQIPPVGEARDDYAIFCDLADRLGFGEAFSEGRDAGQWLRHLYEESRPRAQEEGIALPSFDDFWQQGVLEYSAPERPQIFLADFRADPQRYPLSTPPARLNSFRPPSPGLAIVNATAIRGGMNRRPPGSGRRRRAGRFICSPASRAPACTVSTTTAASAGRRNSGTRAAVDASERCAGKGYPRRQRGESL